MPYKEKSFLNLRKESKIPYGFIALFFALSLIIIAACYYYSSKQRTFIKDALHSELSSLSRHHAEQISVSQNKIMMTAGFFRNNTFRIQAINRFFSNPAQSGLRQVLSDWINLIRDSYRFKKVFISDANGFIRLSTDNNNGLSNNQPFAHFSEVKNQKDIIFKYIHRDKRTGDLHIDVITPLFLNERPIGWLVFVADPTEELLSIKTYLSSFKTQEDVLFNPESSSILYFKKVQDGASNIQYILTEETFPEAKTLKDTSGIVEIIDHRGVPVVAALSPIKNSPWHLMTKIDKSEAYREIKKEAVGNMILCLTLITAAGFGVGLIWRNQQMKFYKSQYALEKEKSVILQKYDHLTKHANDIVFLIDAESQNIVEANERAVEAYGYSEQELLSLNLKDIGAPETASLINTHYKEVLEHNGYLFETLHKRKNGEIFPVEVSSRPIEINDKKYFFAIIRDISERKKAERELEEKNKSLRELEDIINRSPAVAFLCSSKEGLPIEFISANISMYGYHPSDLIIENKPFTNLIYQEDLSKFITNIDKFYAEKIPDFSVQHRIMTKAGEIHWAESRIWPIFDNEGNITHYQGILIDITEQKRLQEQLVQAQKMESIGALAGGIAHDFNNILTAITGYGHLLRMRLEDDKALRRYVDQILSSSERAAQLTQGLLAFSRKQIMSLSPVELNALLGDFKHFLQRLITEDIDIQIFTTPDKLTVMADRTQLEQVLMNLVTNARDAMPDGGSIIIETGTVYIDKEYIKSHGYGKPGMFALLSVTDTGFGMDEQTQKKIFEPFFTTKGVGKGTGLGLSIVYGIIKQLGGYINVYSEIGKGTTFKIYLPMIEGEAPIQQIAERSTLMLSGTETILIAEDDITVRNLYKESLMAFGYEVIEAEDGEIAVKKFIENKDKVQLLILDVIMPVKNGKEAYEEIKKINPNIKALFTSGYTENVIHKKGILDLELDFIRKPVSPNELLRKVREILNRDISNK